MFADLKEYQDLTRIYNESVNISEEERQLDKFIEEEDFTLEELEFCVENFEEICSLEFNNDYLIESNLNEEKRNIFVLRSEYLQQFLNDIRNEMTYKRSSQYVNDKLIRTENTRITI